MVGGCCIIALAIAFRGDSNPFFLGAMGSNELYIWNSKFICDFGKIVFWWQGMNFYPLNPKMGIKDNFISKWF